MAAAAAMHPTEVSSTDASGDVVLPAADGCGDAGAPVPPRVALPLLATIKAAQGAHGLAHGDYRRYRRYCARRLHRLRVTCKVTHGKARYTPRPLTAAAVAAEPRLLEVPLMTAERAWAMAMEVKDEASAALDRGGGGGGGSGGGGGAPAPRNAARARRAVLARLAKATAAARELRALAVATATAETVVEANAYVGWVAGHWRVEAADWVGALAALATAGTLYGKMGAAAAAAGCGRGIGGGGVYADRGEEIAPLVRFCAYHLRRGAGSGGDGPAAAAATAAERRYRAHRCFQLAESHAAAASAVGGSHLGGEGEGGVATVFGGAGDGTAPHSSTHAAAAALYERTVEHADAATAAADDVEMETAAAAVELNDVDSGGDDDSGGSGSADGGGGDVTSVDAADLRVEMAALRAAATAGIHRARARGAAEAAGARGGSDMAIAAALRGVRAAPSGWLVDHLNTVATGAAGPASVLAPVGIAGMPPALALIPAQPVLVDRALAEVALPPGGAPSHHLPLWRADAAAAAGVAGPAVAAGNGAEAADADASAGYFGRWFKRKA
ncbi:hypothetical protein MMPV_010040 [Pyropia vietnamensis]